MIEVKKEPFLDIKKIELPRESVPNVQDVAETVGTAAPLIWYNGLQVQESDIDYFFLDCSDDVPILNLRIQDTSSIFTTTGFPLDDTIVSVFIRAKSNLLREIRLDFKILDFTTTIAGSVTMSCILNCNWLWTEKFESFNSTSSYKVMEDICNKSGLGFGTNIGTTNDQMTWIRPGLSGVDFIEFVTTRSYAGESGFMRSWIDQYGILNFVNLEKALEEDAIALKAPVNMTGPGNIGPASDVKEEVQELILSNDDGLKETNNYIIVKQIINQSTRQSLEGGYRKRTLTYDRGGNWDKKAGSFLDFELDSIVTPGASGRDIVLKGGPNDQKFYKEHIRGEWLGKIDKSNVYIDYNWAFAQNKHNIKSIARVGMVLELKNPNFFLQRGCKVTININNPQRLFTSNKGSLNTTLSGQWLITGINWSYTKSGGFKQILSVIRRELPGGNTPTT